MRSYLRGQVRSSPIFSLGLPFTMAARRKLLLVAGLASAILPSGCRSADHGFRTFVMNPWRAPRSESVVRSSTSPSTSERSPADEQESIALVSHRDEGSSDPMPSTLANGSSALSSQTRESSFPLPSSATPWSLTDLEAIALQHNPTLVQAQAAISSQHGVYRQTGLYPNPQVGYLNGSASNAAVRQSNGLFVSQEIVTANKLKISQFAAAQELKRFQWDLEAQRIRVLNDLKIRYYEVLGAQEAVSVTQRLVKIAGESHAISQRMLEAKQGTRSDLLQAKLQLEMVQLSLQEAEHRYVAAWEQLATIAGIPPLQPVPLIGDLTGDVGQLDLETRWQQLLAESPQLKASESELDHGRASYQEALSQAIPNVTVQTVAEYDKATQATTVSTLVALPLPIFNRNQGNIDKASADIIADQAEICRVQLVLRDQLADSFRRYKTSRSQSERLKETILPCAEDNLQLAQQLYATGETAFAPVLMAQQSYFQSQIAYVESVTELHKIVTEIEGLQLTGGLNPAAIGSAIQNQPGGGAQRQRALLNEIQDRASKQLLPAAQIGQ